MPSPDKAALEAVVAANEIGWFHSIDLGQGVVTPGFKSPAVLANELAAIDFGDLTGKTVLDIGAWDGFYSFEAERRGAERVVALDHFAWSLHSPKQHRYVERCRAEGRPIEAYEQVPEIWDPVGLPGKQGFDLVHQALGSRVETVVADFMTVTPEQLGTFDVVLFLGVLYHVKSPLESLEKVASLCRGMTVIETEAVHVEGMEDASLCEFYPADELGGDITNWWAPNLTALVGLCRAAGFATVETSAPTWPEAPPPEAPAFGWRQRLAAARHPPSPSPLPPKAELSRYRTFVHAYK